MNKFDTALYLLQEALRHNTELVIHPATDNIQAHQNIIILRDRECLSNAIRVLEAVGNIPDKTLALCVFNDLFSENRVPDDLRESIGAQLRPLISALPD